MSDYWLGISSDSQTLRSPDDLGAGLPLVALLYSLMTIDSGLRFWRGVVAAWKGRAYQEAGKVTTGTSSD